MLSALLCITRRNPVASALWLVVTLFALAALFVLLDAQFIAVLQVLVYAGAIRNSTMIAPAYTSTGSTAMNCASRRTNSAARANSVSTSHSALAMGLRRVTHNRALPTAI